MAVAHRDTPAVLRKHGYSEIKKVGEGSFGKAILVRGQNGQQLICKMVDISRASKKEMEDAVKEGKLLASLSHPYIVHYRESFSDSGWFCILMDFCECGDLSKEIAKFKKKGSPIPENQVMTWFVQCILALKYIHDRHILHRDLKPQNLFLCKDGGLQVGDFGVSKVLECTIAVARTQIGTPYYLAPELCQAKPYSTPCDMWSMGVILYEMGARKVPFDAASIPALVQNITSGRIPTLSVPGYSSHPGKLVSELLERDPKRRPGTDEILAKPEIQERVKLMMEEAEQREAQQNKDVPAAPKAAPQAAPQPAQIEGLHKEKAGKYSKDDLVEFYSKSHQGWLPAIITNVDDSGSILIDLKPNTWISCTEQASSVRSREAAVNAPSAAPRQASPLRGVGTPRSNSPAAGTPRLQRCPSSGTPRNQGGTDLPRPGSRGASPMHRSPSAGNIRPLSARGSAGSYKIGDLVEFWSNSHNDWLPAHVKNVDASGRIIIDLKPNTWISKDEQSTKVRPRAPAVVERPYSGRRPSQQGASPQLPRPPLHRSPSWGNNDNRAPSPAGRIGTPLRSQSPSSRGREMTPMRAASPSNRGGREMTPLRAPSPSGWRAPSPSGRGYRPPSGRASPLRVGGSHIAGM